VPSKAARSKPAYYSKNKSSLHPSSTKMLGGPTHTPPPTVWITFTSNPTTNILPFPHKESSAPPPHPPTHPSHHAPVTNSPRAATTPSLLPPSTRQPPLPPLTSLPTAPSPPTTAPGVVPTPAVPRRQPSSAPVTCENISTATAKTFSVDMKGVRSQHRQSVEKEEEQGVAEVGSAVRKIGRGMRRDTTRGWSVSGRGARESLVGWII
jgi:hypothetical protein